MKTVFGVTVVLVLSALLAVPATAGMEFATSFSDPGLSTATISYSSSGGSYGPPGLVTVTGGTGAPTYNAVLDFAYSPPANFTTLGSPEVVIWFGSISNSFLLTAVGISEDGGTTFTTQSFAQTIDSAFANDRFPIALSTGLGGIPLADRDEADVVRLSFSLGAGRSFVIDGVSTPEPGTLALFGLGLAALGGAFFRRRRAKR